MSARRTVSSRPVSGEGEGGGEGEGEGEGEKEGLDVAEGFEVHLQFFFLALILNP
jgi:hypothetical protein